MKVIGCESKIQNACQGVTLVELMVVIAMLAIVLGVALVNLKSYRFKVKYAAYNLRTNLLKAKSEAVKRNSSVRVLFDPAADSYNATVGGTLLFSLQLKDNVDLSTNNTSVSFSSTGTATNAKIVLNSNDKRCTLRVTSSGRVYIVDPCPE